MEPEEPSILIQAVWPGRADQVVSMLERGADPNDQVSVRPKVKLRIHSEPYYGQSALGEAMRTRNYEIAQILLSYGANPNLTDSRDRSAWIFLCENLQDDLAFSLFDQMTKSMDIPPEDSCGCIANILEIMPFRRERLTYFERNGQFAQCANAGQFRRLLDEHSFESEQPADGALLTW